MTCCDKHFIGGLVNWLAALKRLQIDNYLVVALDKPMHNFLLGIGEPVVAYITDNSLSPSKPRTLIAMESNISID